MGEGINNQKNNTFFYYIYISSMTNFLKLVKNFKNFN